MTHLRFTRQWLAAACVVGALLVLSACGNASGPTLPSANSVLTKAEQAPLKDATFSVTLNGGGDGGTGTGRLTTSPKRTEEVSTAGPYPGMQLTDSTGYYIKFPTKDATWAKVTIQDIVENGGPDFLLQPDFLEYSQLQQVKVLGSETINGQPTWHLRGSRPVTDPLARFYVVPMTLQEDLWFRQDNAYPAKLVFSFVPTAGGDSADMITLVFTAWDTGLTIALPQVSN